MINLSALHSLPAGQIPRGVADHFWEEAYRRRELEHTLLALFRTWGYDDVIPPSFEYADTLATRANPELQAEMCRFVDRDGSMLALRVDMTIAVARLVATRLHDWPMPQRFCYAGSVFRDVEPRAGQQREFWQAGVELIGSAAPEADAEVLALTAKALEELGLEDFRIVIGQIQYFDGILQALRLADGDRLRLQQAVDRNSEAELAAFLRDVPMERHHYRTLAELPELSGGGLPEILARAQQLCLNETMAAAVANLRAIGSVLTAHNVIGRTSLDLTEIHNLGYYTGITFEVLAPGVGFRLASGGRYDHLVGTFGVTQPAVGVAFGLERLLLAQRAAAGSRKAPAPIAPDILVSAGGDAVCFEMIESGRRLGLRIAIDLQNRRGLALWDAAQTQEIKCALDCQPDGLVLYEVFSAGEPRVTSLDPADLHTVLSQLAQAMRDTGQPAQSGARPWTPL